MRIQLVSRLAVSLALISVGSAAVAEPISINGVEYESWQAYGESEYFQTQALRCGTVPTAASEGPVAGAPADCAISSTTILPEYDPGAVLLINVVVHVITNTSGQGNLSQAMVQSQIDILNEDFLALAGTNGANGNYSAVQFQLATEDPGGSPTTGITYTTNNNWHNDVGNYWSTLEWDPNTYLNIYTNTAGGFLGYVPNLPQGGGAGASGDRVVCLYSAFGRNAPFVPYHLGRTATHEVGHYLGLHHTFSGGCASVSNCYNNGDYICDTAPEGSSNFGCPASRNTCVGGGSDPIDNYMDYSDDICMEQFTPEQVNRVRCTIENYRPNLAVPAGAVGVNTIAESRSFQLLHQNTPNPFSPQTQISFELPVPGQARLRVLDVAGRTVRTLATGEFASGNHQVTWDGTDEASAPVAAGVYFYRLDVNGASETLRMVKMK